MGNEVELKFLLYEGGQCYATDAFRNTFGERDALDAKVEREGMRMVQGYLGEADGKKLAENAGIVLDFEPTTYRIRQEGSEFKFTVKGKGLTSRREEEKDISGAVFGEYLPRAEGIIRKSRLTADYHGHKIEIDAFDDFPLVFGELEGTSLDDILSIPAPGKDISADPKYTNQALAGQQVK